MLRDFISAENKSVESHAVILGWYSDNALRNARRVKKFW